MLRNLLRPLAYLTIDHRQKWVVDWLYPLLLAALSTAVLFILKSKANFPLYADNAIVGKILGFVQGLPGFYIAALAAIATFNKIDIDKTMPAPAPKLGIMIQGKSIAIELTRRRFLCSMFAFLTAESFFVIVMAILGETLSAPIKSLLPTSLHCIASAAFIFVLMLAFWQMLVTSFFGLFYLGDRLHQPDQ